MSDGAEEPPPVHSHQTTVVMFGFLTVAWISNECKFIINSIFVAVQTEKYRRKPNATANFKIGFGSGLSILLVA